MSKWQDPVKVSPIIRGARWTLLVMGIVYGVSKHKAYSMYEDSIRGVELERKIALQEKLKQEKAIAAEQELTMLEELFLGKPDEDES